MLRWESDEGVAAAAAAAREERKACVRRGLWILWVFKTLARALVRAEAREQEPQFHHS